MTLNPSYRLRSVAGEYLLLNESGAIDLTAALSLSESAAWLWRQCEGCEFTQERLVELLLGEYDVDETTAREDVAELLETWHRYKLVVD